MPSHHDVLTTGQLPRDGSAAAAEPMPLVYQDVTKLLE